MMLCLAFVFVLGAQKSTAQTMTELGEVRSERIYKAIQSEMQFLEQEMKYPAGSVNTDKNEQIIMYYNDVLSSFGNGGDIKEAFMYIESTYGAANANEHEFANHPANAVMDPAGLDLKDLGELVDQLDLSDDDDSDLDAIFNYWRTLKNQ